MNKEFFQIAIDGPVAAGKGTVSRKLAERLEYLYVDTGATYRVATLIAMRNNFNFDNLDQQVVEDVVALTKLVDVSQLDMRIPVEGERDGRLITVLLNKEDVSWPIRNEKVSAKVYIVAKIPEVREVLVRKQQEIAAANDVVMEGRDITYRVLPEAQLKIYLDATQEERIRRRIEQLDHRGETYDKEDVIKEIKKRDEIDMNREADPLKITEDAWHFDATGLSIDETVDQIVDRVREIQQ
jgi:cytidylate kinase